MQDSNQPPDHAEVLKRIETLESELVQLSKHIKLLEQQQQATVDTPREIRNGVTILKRDPMDALYERHGRIKEELRKIYDSMGDSQWRNGFASSLYKD